MKVTLVLPHRHDGQDHKPGDVIDVTEQQAQSLRSWGVVAAEKPAKTAAAGASTDAKAG